jgi:ketosteroid isomerase-like protein
MKSILVVLLALPLLAQTAPGAGAPAKSSAAVPKMAYGVPQDESGRPLIAGPAQQVSMAQLRLRDAALTGDFEALGRMLAGDCLVTLPSGSALNRTQLLDAIRSAHNTYASLEYSEMQVRMPAPSVGVVTARVEAKGAVTSVYRLTAVWQKLPAGWKVLVIQVTPVL